MEILIGLVFLGASLAVAFVLPVLSYLRASKALQRADALARDVQALHAEIVALRATPPMTAAPPTQSDAGPARAAWVAEVRDLAATPPPPMPTGSIEAPGEATLATPSRVGDVLDEREAPSPVPTAAPALMGASTPIEAATSAAALAAPADSLRPISVPPIGEPDVSGLPKADGRMPTADSLEERIGARWLLYAGIGSLVLGLSYFIKFAFDNGWVSEPLRVATGLAAGGALLWFGQRFVRQGLAFFGHALSGGGLVVLYVAIYAALHVYGLIAPPLAFAAMLAVTALGTWLADRHRVQVLAALSLLGAFVTPVLVGGSEDRQLFLFVYNALLLAGALAMVVRHAWAGIAVLAYALAVLMSAAWAATFYRPALGLRTLLLLTVHLGIVIGMIIALRRQRARSSLAIPASWVLLSAPLLYHAAALWLIGRSQGTFLVYLLVATVAGLSGTYHAGWRWARTIVLVLVMLPFADWLQHLATPRWYAAGIVTAIALYLLHLAGQWRDLSDDDPAVPVPLSELVHTHATGAFLPLTLYAFFAEHAAWWNAPILTGLALWNLAVAAVLRVRMPVLSSQFVALGASIGAVAVSEWFEGPLVAIGWAIEGAALGHTALRSRHRWLDAGAVGLLILSALRLIDALIQPMAVGTWPIVNTRAFATLVIVGAMAWLAARANDDPDPVAGPRASWPDNRRQRAGHRLDFRRDRARLRRTGLRVERCGVARGCRARGAGAAGRALRGLGVVCGGARRCRLSPGIRPGALPGHRAVRPHHTEGPDQGHRGTRSRLPDAQRARARGIAGGGVLSLSAHGGQSRLDRIGILLDNFKFRISKFQNCRTTSTLRWLAVAGELLKF